MRHPGELAIELIVFSVAIGLVALCVGVIL